MKFNRCIAIIAAVFLIAVSGLATADVLPKAVPENQVFSVSSIIEAVGAVTESTSLVWQIGDAGLTSLPAAKGAVDRDGRPLHSIRSGSIGYMTYSDSIMTNGGQISEVKSFSMDTHEKKNGLFNIETAKVLTYTSQNGSHLMGEESYVLDVAGNWSAGLDDIVCVFAQASKDVIPAFCNKVTASAKLNQVTTAQIETVGSLTGVGATANVPAALNFEISVTPDANSASGYADGIFSTTFTVSIMEGRSDGRIWSNPTENWITQNVMGAPDALGNPRGFYNVVYYDRGNPRANAEGFVTLTAQEIRDLGFAEGNSRQLINPNLAAAWVQPNGGAPGVFTPPGGFALGPPAGNPVLSTVYFVPVTERVLQSLGGPAGWEDNFNTMDVWGGLTYELENYDQLASTLTYIDSATVAGGVSTFNKAFSYESGIYCDKCNL